MPEKIFKKLNERISPSWKVCFFAAFFVGLLAHIYKIVNWLPNWDSLVFRYDPQNMIAIGRWFLPVVCSFSSFYDLPFLNGIIAIVFHALSAVLICRIFGVRKKITAFLIGAVIVSFPTVTSVLMYNYVADGYGIAFFLSVLAAYFMTKEKPKYLVSGVFITLSTAIYQAYLTVTITLVLFHLIDAIVFKNETTKNIFKRIGFMLLTGIAGVVLYSAVLKLLLGVFSVELLDYQGANATASLSNLNLSASLYIVKETFINRFFDISNGINVFIVVNIIVFVFTFVFYLNCLIKNKLYKTPVRLILVIALGILLVLGACALAFINASIDYHNLMLMGYVIFYLIFLLIYERGIEKRKVYSAIKCWSVLFIAVLLIANQVVIANVSFHKAQIAYEKSYGVLVRMADRIEQTPNSESCEKLLVVGALENSENYGVNLTPDITGITDGYIIRSDDEDVGQSVLCSALNDYCGKNYKFLSGNEKKKLVQNQAVKEMGIWPQNNSVAVIGDTIVIKLSAEGEN